MPSFENVTTKVWSYGEWIEIAIGQEVFIGKCGTGHSLFGEFATLTRMTKTQLIFTTESGQTFKTNSSLNVLGSKRAKDHIVSLKVSRDRPHLIISKVLL